MWTSKRLDVSWTDLIYGLTACFVPGRRAAKARVVEECWSAGGDGLVALSVRSGFDLLLSAAEFPVGSEVIFSALTIADMPRIVEHHGLVAIPIDIDRETTQPRVDALHAAVTSNTRAIVVTHLYGGRLDVEPIVAFARTRGLMVIEDCAQAFAGPGYTGHPDSDVAMFSFGPIKTATAFGGGLLRVRDANLLARMRQRQQEYAVQPTGAYAARLLKYAVLHAVSGQVMYGTVLALLRAVGVDHDRLVHRLTRGFSGPEFFARIRRRPCVALLRMLHRRLREDHARLARRIVDGDALQRRLGATVTCPGGSLTPHHYWVFPILAPEPKRLIRALREAGFDATEGRSFDVVQNPLGSGAYDTTQAKDILSHAVYLPFYPEMSRRGWERMAQVLSDDIVRDVSPADFRDPVRSRGASSRG
ncbi:MAG: DegT/DnrJ/EryC1/StrS aminotransferase family protein [Gemmatimonadetes bacterium]|nr:DegT/DnrJ/EryC1/StrS aminotransferase family protein [Gemmatimonadota bacterium]